MPGTSEACQGSFDFGAEGLTSDAAHRQRMVAIELAGSGTVQRIALRNLSPATAEAYAQRGPKTITRDVNRLVGLSLS
jgi:hypothetical protein